MIHINDYYYNKIFYINAVPCIHISFLANYYFTKVDLGISFFEMDSKMLSYDFTNLGGAKCIGKS